MRADYCIKFYVIHTYIHLFKSGNMAHTKHTHTKDRQRRQTDRQNRRISEHNRMQKYTQVDTTNLQA